MTFCPFRPFNPQAPPMKAKLSFLVMCLLLVQMPAWAAESPKDAWPVFRGDAQSTGTAVGSLPEKLVELWKFEVKGGAFEGTAAIADGIVYLGDLDGAVRAWDLSTGKIRWEKKWESGF